MLLLSTVCAYTTGSRPAIASRRCDAPRCSLLSDLATAPALADLASVPLVPGAAGLVAASVAGAAWATRPTGPVGAPYPADAKGYDPEAADVFYGSRLPFVAARLLRLGSLTLAFNLRLGLDYLAYKRAGAPEGEPWPNEADRAREALGLATQLGPTFIKLAQALSIRTDLIPETYALELRQLQDAVPAFDSDEARAILARELLAPGAKALGLTSIFTELSVEPMAAASIGQVYKGTLLDGRQVAVKVQRPSILDEIALDLYVLRILTPLQTRLSNLINRVPTYPEDIDLARELVDEWGRGFVAETDYRYEAANTAAFSEAMKRRGLGAVTSPTVVGELSTNCVLVTEWVDGTRLDLDASPDVPRLCGVAINAYLTMLLDTGTLHCDPHPGNLLRTTDGKLCILDFGMCLEVPPDLQLSLLEFIANLQAENYEEVPNDLVKLSFVPAEKIDELRASGLTVALAQTIRIAAKGGGPKGAMKRLVAENKEKYAPQLLAKFGTTDSPEATKERQRLFREDWQREMAEDAMARGGDEVVTSTTADITGKIEEMQKQNSNVFAIPDYFVYMSRAFATLEGIGLSADPDYAILQECFPYLAKRLLSDDSPRARGALRTLLYGQGEELNLDQLQKVTQGLESYTTSTASVAASTGESDAGRTAALEQIAAVLLAEDGNYVQSLVLREAAVALDAAARSTLASTAAPLTRLPALPTPPAALAPLFAPVLLPLQLGQAALELQAVDERDERRLQNLQILADLTGFSGVVRPTAMGGGAAGGAAADGDGAATGGGGGGGARLGQLRSLVGEAAARRTALARTGLRFGSTLATLQAERLRQQEGDVRTSDLASQLAAASAGGLERVASAISSADENFGAERAGPRLPAEGK